MPSDLALTQKCQLGFASIPMWKTKLVMGQLVMGQLTVGQEAPAINCLLKNSDYSITVLAQSYVGRLFSAKLGNSATTAPKT